MATLLLLTNDMRSSAEILPALEKQIADEKGKTEFARVNEDLRRLYVKIKRSSS